MTLELRYEYKLLPKQRLFVHSTADEKCYSGGFGGGKTRAGLIDKCHIRGQDPRMVCYVARAKLEDVKQYVLPTLFERDGDRPPVLPPGTYTWNKADRTVRLHTGGVIRYVGLGDKQTRNLDRMGFRGGNITDLFIDQAEEITLEQYENALGRMRSDGSGMRRQVSTTANPAAPSHWIAQRFGIKPSHDPMTTGTIETERRATDPRTGKEVVMRLLAVLTCPLENPYLPADYIAKLMSYTGVMRQRYVLGRWVGSEGAVYENWDRAIHAVKRSGPWARTIVGVDDGVTHPAAILLGRVDGDGRIHIERSTIGSGMLMERKIAAIRAFGPIEVVVCDPSNAQLKEELRARGIPVINGHNAVTDGIQIVKDRLEQGADGRPGLTVDPDKNERLITQIEGYSWDQRSAREQPIKVEDDGPDALRYIVAHVHRPPAMVFDIKNLTVARETAARMKALRGSLFHNLEAGQAQDESLEAGERAHIWFGEKGDGPMRLWGTFKRNSPARDTVYAVFASCGDGANASPTVISVGDVARSSVVAEWSTVATPDRAARVAMMLSLWFSDKEGDPAPIGYHATGAGMIFRQHVDALGGQVGLAWTPNPKQFAEGVGVLRTVWESGRLNDGAPEAFAEAMQYVWSNQTVMHFSLIDDTERRGSWSDRVISRAGLWQLMSTLEAPEPDEYEASPFSIKGATMRGH